MGLTAAGIGQRAHENARVCVGVCVGVERSLSCVRLCPGVAGWIVLIPASGIALGSVRMHGQFGRQERDGLLTTDLTQVAQAQSRPLAGLKRCGALKVGQREIAFAITTVRRSQKRKQCCVLVNGKHLAVAKRPPLRGEVTRKNPNFGNELVGHGLEWVWSVDTGEDALERDDKIEREVRRHILVRLVAAHSGDRTRAEVSVGLSGQSIRIRAAGRPNMVGGQALIGGGRAAHRKMAVDGKFGNAEGMTRLPAKLAQGETAAKMHRNAPLEIREAKGDPAIAAVIGSEEGKERLVLINGQQLPITKCPSFRGEIKRDNADFRQER